MHQNLLQSIAIEPGAKWVLRRLLHSTDILTPAKSGLVGQEAERSPLKPRKLTAKLTPILHARAAGVHCLRRPFGASDLRSQLKLTQAMNSHIPTEGRPQKAL